jgi:UDP-N-acetyl-D-mannosaminuronic acid dehydrogenase
VVDTVNSGRVHIEEVDLDGLVQGVVARGTLRASPRSNPPTCSSSPCRPRSSEDNAPDISYVLNAARTIAPVLGPGNVVILESTSPVGTTEAMRDLLEELRPDLKMPHAGNGATDIAIAYCPERVLPGKILVELIDNDRSSAASPPLRTQGAVLLSRLRARRVHHHLRKSGGDGQAGREQLPRRQHRLCQRTVDHRRQWGIDVWEVIALANRHPRVNILQPGPGVGGHCIAVDPWFIVHARPGECAADPHRARGEPLQDRPCARQSRQT